jgi:glycosyltransferase involved in cell wall biosynthesis
MAEALACGTPVLGLARGAVSEVVRHGINGFLATSVGELALFVDRLPELSRAACRRDVAERFGEEVIVGHYAELYRRLSDQSGASKVQ